MLSYFHLYLIWKRDFCSSGFRLYFTMRKKNKKTLKFIYNLLDTLNGLRRGVCHAFSQKINCDFIFHSLNMEQPSNSNLQEVA